MKKETRAGKYGRFLAVWINYTITSYDNRYRKRFLEELKRYSFKPRKKDEPRHEGCILELEDIAELDMNNPEHLAKLVKEGFHLMYQKSTSTRVFASLQSNIET